MEALISLVLPLRNGSLATVISQVKRSVTKEMLFNLYQIAPSSVRKYSLEDVVEHDPNEIPVSALPQIPEINSVSEKNLVHDDLTIGVQDILNIFHSFKSEASRQIMVHIQLAALINEISPLLKLIPQYKIDTYYEDIVVVNETTPVNPKWLPLATSQCRHFFIWEIYGRR